MSHLAQALLLNPDFPEALDRLAWILATDQHAEVRNGVEAVRMAERACELTGHQRAPLELTLAAAYGEAGRFEEAVRTAETASRLLTGPNQDKVRDKCRTMVNQLKASSPWRE